MLSRLILFAIILFMSCNTDSSPKVVVIKESSAMVPTDHLIHGRENVKRQMKEVLALQKRPFFQDSLIPDSATAVAIAEPILFNIYGKNQILSERPYEVYLIDSVWYLSGTIPKAYPGGGFEIAINSGDGRIMSLTHYK